MTRRGRPGALPALGLALLLACFAVGRSSEATVFHIVRQGDTVNSLATEYYGEAKLATVIRGANHLPLDEEIELSVGEPLIIPESARRIVKAGDTWEDLARIELGSTMSAWYLAEVNGAKNNQAPAEGQIVNIPYLLPLALAEGLAATVNRFYPDQTNRDRIATARMLIKLNPGLRPRGMAKGTRVVIPLLDLSILPEKRAAVERALANRRSEQDQARQAAATEQLEQLPALLGRGSYVELVLLAGRISGATELTEAQRVTLYRYLGQALLALDHRELALHQFVEMVALQPDVQFDQVTTSPTVLELLEAARRQRAQGGERPGGGPTKAVNNR